MPDWANDGWHGEDGGCSETEHNRAGRSSDQVLDTQFNQESFEKNEDKTKGLPNFLVLIQIFELCEPYVTCGPMSLLSKFEQFVLVLLRLRLNLPLKDLAFRFKNSLSTASRVWHSGGWWSKMLAGHSNRHGVRGRRLVSDYLFSTRSCGAQMLLREVACLIDSLNCPIMWG